MRKILGFLLILAGIALGAYVGIYLFFVGGIVELVHGASASPVSGHELGWGIARIVLAGFAGWVSAFALAVPGAAIAASGD